MDNRQIRRTTGSAAGNVAGTGGASPAPGAGAVRWGHRVGKGVVDADC